MNQYVIFVILLYVFAMGVTSQRIDINSNQFNIDSEWMRYVNGNLKLNQLNIPGTRDSGSFNIKVTEEEINRIKNSNGEPNYFDLLNISIDNALESLGRTQSKSIFDQLNSGVRYLDLRLAWDDIDETTILAYGPLNCKDEKGNDLTMENVFNTCIQFLNQHNNETIIAHLKYENLVPKLNK